MSFLYTIGVDRREVTGLVFCKYLENWPYFQYNYGKMFVQLLYSLLYAFVEAVNKYVKVSVRSCRQNSSVVLVTLLRLLLSVCIIHTCF